MRLIAVFLVLLMCISGCNSTSSSIDPAAQFRNKLLNSEGCSFNADITADYGDEVYCFKLNCLFDEAGNMTFSVLEPDTLESLTGNVDATSGALTFDNSVLAFPIMADDILTPVSSPWFLINGLRSGYLVAFGTSQNGYQIKIDDNYSNHNLRIDAWMDQQMMLTGGEIFWDGRRIMTILVEDFMVL